mgnify:CR=1 FL=1
MAERTINIKISGPTGSGKTAVGLLILSALQSHGITCGMKCYATNALATKQRHLEDIVTDMKAKNTHVVITERTGNVT